MISFKNVNDDDIFGWLMTFLPEMGEADSEELIMMIESFREVALETNGVALSTAGGCLLVRVCDGGEYLFLFPIALFDDAEIETTFTELSEYVRRELLPFRMTDIPRWGIDILRASFPHVDARAYEDDEDVFAALILNELDLIEDYPTIERDGLTLSPITDADAADYARLCSDRELNKYWGFDDLADNPSADPERFMLTVEREKRDGVALSLAVRRDGKYLGEAVIYNCDYQGSAEIGIRLLPEYHGEGLGIRVLDALLDYCEDIGITALRARVMEENTPAVAMTKKRMVITDVTDGVVSFFLLLTDFELDLSDQE